MLGEMGLCWVKAALSSSWKKQRLPSAAARTCMLKSLGMAGLAMHTMSLPRPPMALAHS